MLLLVSGMAFSSMYGGRMYYLFYMFNIYPSCATTFWSRHTKPCRLSFRYVVYAFCGTNWSCSTSIYGQSQLSLPLNMHQQTHFIIITKHHIASPQTFLFPLPRALCPDVVLSVHAQRLPAGSNPKHCEMKHEKDQTHTESPCTRSV